MEAEDDTADYKAHANAIKDEANVCFQKGETTQAIELYTRAIDLDPDDPIFYSNRSAAYMKADMKSKALYDAEKCVALDPKWSKGYTRLGAAQQSLKRFDAAIDTFKKGIELDPANKMLWSALKACQEANEADKKRRFSTAAIERDAEEQRLRRIDDAKKAAEAEKKIAEAEKKMAEDEAALFGFFAEVQGGDGESNQARDRDYDQAEAKEGNVVGENGDQDPEEQMKFKQEQQQQAPVKKSYSGVRAGGVNTDDDNGNTGEGEGPPVDAAKFAEEDDLLAGFFSEVSAEKESKQKKVVSSENTSGAAAGEGGGGEKSNNKEAVVRDETSRTEKYTNQELGSSKQQYDRLMAPRYEWRNLNPYYVLQLEIDATEEDIKQRYRKLAAKLHPDKLRGVENATECFDQVKTAYQKLTDEKQKHVIVMNIEKITNDTIKERKRLLAKGIKESDMPSLEDQAMKGIMKHFAEIEMLRRRSEHNLRAYNAREKMQESEEKEKVQQELHNEKEWAEGDRREKRVGNWRGFQEEPEAKKVKASNFKEETRTDAKHGKAKMEEWKKKWK